MRLFKFHCRKSYSDSFTDLQDTDIFINLDQVIAMFYDYDLDVTMIAMSNGDFYSVDLTLTQIEEKLGVYGDLVHE